jgi:hypothetical protein
MPGRGSGQSSYVPFTPARDCASRIRDARMIIRYRRPAKPVMSLPFGLMRFCNILVVTSALAASVGIGALGIRSYWIGDVWSTSGRRESYSLYSVHGALHFRAFPYPTGTKGVAHHSDRVDSHVNRALFAPTWREDGWRRFIYRRDHNVTHYRFWPGHRLSARSHIAVSVPHWVVFSSAGLIACVQARMGSASGCSNRRRVTGT